MKIYVGNLSYEVTEDELRQEFSAFGKVDSAALIMDKYSGRSKGFAFIEMPTVSEGQEAINTLNGKVIKDRAISVSAARERTEDRSHSYGSGDRGGRSYGGGGDKRGGGFKGGGNSRRF
jgi:cold-inducible RNA-binding protein